MILATHPSSLVAATLIPRDSAITAEYRNEGSLARIFDEIKGEEDYLFCGTQRVVHARFAPPKRASPA
eukprot:scaffold143331_cov163-Phaeocystis_antarctica.AAC.1